MNKHCTKHSLYKIYRVLLSTQDTKQEMFIQAEKEHFIRHAEEIRTNLGRPGFYVGAITREDGSIAGAVCLSPRWLKHFKNPEQFELRTGYTALIGNVTFVHIDEEFQRQGLGTKLMTELIRQARQMGYKELQLTSTREGERLYRKLGFIAQGERSGQIDMTLDLERQESPAKEEHQPLKSTGRKVPLWRRFMPFFKESDN